MKRIVLFSIGLIISINIYLPGSEPDWELAAGIRLSPGLAFAGTWDTEYAGSGASLLLSRNLALLSLSAGIETGYTHAGWETFLPLGAGFTFARAAPMAFGIEAFIMPGILLSRPSPYFLIAGEAAFKIDWRVAEKLAFSLSSGLRLTVNPGYEASVGPYESLDLPIRFAARLGL